MRTSLTGIKPTATPHLGNFLGAIRPALALAPEYRTIYFIADYHALTSLRDPNALRNYIYDVTATWLACGLDPSTTILFRQSAIKEVFELAWVLSCLLATGQLERGHSYKEALAKGDAPNAGTFYYPVLMAADVLLYDTDVVPVGKDQKQHLELARDVAVRLNHTFGESTIMVPEAVLAEVPLIPGLDGEKMSKSRGNSIPLFAPAKELRATVMKIKTGSEGLADPKTPEGSTVFEIYRAIASPERVNEMADALRRGGYGWGHAKEALFDALESELGPRREQYLSLRADEDALDEILADGARRARDIAKETMRRVRRAVGIDRDTRERRTVKLRP